MPWVSRDLKSALPADFKNLADEAKRVQKSLSTVVTFLKGAVAVVQAFMLGTIDPTAVLANAIITEIENVVNDFFNAGFFMLVITPDKVTPRTYDLFGLPTMTPDTALKAAVASFDDLGDLRRPQFNGRHDQASVCGFGLMVTGASPDEILSRMKTLVSLFNVSGLQVYLNKIQKRASKPPPSSVLPNWVSIKVADLPAFGPLQKSVIGYLEQFRGYLTVGDQYLHDLADVYLHRINSIIQATNNLNKAIDNIVNAIGASGVYYLDIPTGPGGNNRLKSAIPDSNLSKLHNNKYTAMILFVAGGPDTTTMTNLKKVIG